MIATHTQQFSFSQFRRKIAVPPSPSNSLSPRNIPTSLEKITSMLIMAAFLCPFSAKPWSKVSWNHWDYFYRLHGLSCSPECTTKLVLISECRAQWCCCQRAPLAPGDLLLPQQRLQLHSPWPRGPGDAVNHGGLLCSLWNYQLYLALTSHTKVAWNEMSMEPVLHPQHQHPFPVGAASCAAERAGMQNCASVLSFCWSAALKMERNN